VARAPSPVFAGLQGSCGSRYTRIEMARKKKLKKFRVVTAVKELARERIGTPPPTQVVPDRKKRAQEKHKPTLGKLLGES
jgi:hypothetical protein